MQWRASDERSWPMSSNRIDELIDEVQAAFDHRPEELEAGLDVETADLLQLRKACRLLGSAEQLLEEGFYTLVVEASFVAIERSVEFRLLEKGTADPHDLPGSHASTYDEAVTTGILSESQAIRLEDLWSEYRAKTYYQDGLASAERAKKLYQLASEVHEFIVGRSRHGYECICE